MRKSKITTLTSNADAAAIETARAALTASSGQGVLPGGEVSFTIAANSTGTEQFIGGDLVLFAYMPVAVNADGFATSYRWSLWRPVDGQALSVVAGSAMTVIGSLSVPPGASRVIALPLAVSDSAGASSYACGIFFHAPSTIG